MSPVLHGQSFGAIRPTTGSGSDRGRALGRSVAGRVGFPGAKCSGGPGRFRRDDLVGVGRWLEPTHSRRDVMQSGAEPLLYARLSRWKVSTVSPMRIWSPWVRFQLSVTRVFAT